MKKQIRDYRGRFLFNDIESGHRKFHINFNIFILILVVFVAVASFWRDVLQTKAIVGDRVEARDRDLKIEALSKNVPVMTVYLLLVKELETASKGRLTATELTEIARVILTACQSNKELGLTPSLIMSLVERESGFNPKAVSESHAVGMMQILLPTAEMHLRDMGYNVISRDLLLNPIINVEVGLREIIRLRKYWLAEGIDSWMVTANSYYWGASVVWELFLTKSKANLPSLEYGKSIVDGSKKWIERGL